MQHMLEYPIFQKELARYNSSLGLAASNFLFNNIQLFQHHQSLASGANVVDSVSEHQELLGDSSQELQKIWTNLTLQSNCEPRLQLLCSETHEHSACKEELQLERRLQEPAADV